MSSIHPTALVDPLAVIEEGVVIGPYCVIAKGVHLKKNVQLKSHVVIEGRTIIGEDTIVYPFASLGMAPQDLKYKNEDSLVRIGKRCTIREYVTIQRGTRDGRMETSIEDDCLLMVGVHIAHDCRVGSHVIMANYATLAGHVEIDDHVIIGGLSAVQQFTRIGEHAMIGGMSGIDKDVIPYGLTKGERAHLEGLNIIGLKRSGYPSREIIDLQNAVEKLFDETSSSNTAERRQDLAASNPNRLIETVLNFIQKQIKRPLCKPRRKN